ncbi:MAG: GC-type dockerin domain-anchored protein, partial [Phycisphaerales bacterium JB064]
MIHRTVSVLALAGLATAANAQFTAYADRGAWESDPIVGGVFELEDFGAFDVVLNPSTGTIATDWGAIDVTGVDRAGSAITGGVFDGAIFPASGHVSYVFTFDTPVQAFGWDTFGAASGIAIAIETDEGIADLLDFIPGGFTDSFLGFTSVTPVSEVRIIASPSYPGTAVGEIFDADDMVYAGGAPCRADFDGDGQLTIFDFLAFQNAFDAGDIAADFDGDGSLTLFDFLAFQNEFDAGC